MSPVSNAAPASVAELQQQIDLTMRDLRAAKDAAVGLASERRFAELNANGASIGALEQRLVALRAAQTEAADHEAELRADDHARRLEDGIALLDTLEQEFHAAVNTAQVEKTRPAIEQAVTLGASWHQLFS